jgi:putative phosphoribosyl transferase
MTTTMNIRNEVMIPMDHTHLQGLLTVPHEARGVVIFVHGSGSSRFSIRNQEVARSLNELGIATLLFDLLTADEGRIDERDGRYRFNVSLLMYRLIAVTRWVSKHPDTHGLQIGYFGASTGAAAAIAAAAEVPELVTSIVSRGGRPDLAGVGALHELKTPTLFIVGSEDFEVVELNRLAAREMRVEHRTVVIDGATHLFEEPGALQQVSDNAATWFLEHFTVRIPTRLSGQR